SSDEAATLRDNRVARIESGRAIETHESLYRVFAPIVRGTKVVGAVEISHHLDNLPSILKRLFGTAASLALLAIGLIALATYIMFRDLVYRPIEYLLGAIEQATLGIFNVQPPDR